MTQGAQKPVIGIIGDGQLALMLADSLKEMNLPFLAYSSSNNSPMEILYPAQTVKSISELQERAQVFTLENEFFSTDELLEMLKEKTESLFPSLVSYQHFSDKISQRKLYASLDLPSPRWMEITGSDLDSIYQNGFSFPFIIKAPAGGYDGKGVRVIRNPSDFNKAADQFGLYDGKTLLLEEMVSIKQELAQGFLRSEDGKFTLLPLVETVQVNGICQYVYYPAPVNTKVAEQIESALRKLIDHGLTGIFNFEFFVDHNDDVFINEGAPRPHNSQHLTIDASTYSQFDLLAKYLANEDDIPETVSTRSSAMVNILGKSQGPNYQLTLPEITPGVFISPKLYGKEICSPGRKMGHVNLVDPESTHDLRQIALQVFKEYNI